MSRELHGILLDVVNREVKVVEFDDDLQSFYDFLG